MTQSGDTEVLEPEVIPPGESDAKEAETTPPPGINPIFGGLVIDILRFVVAGPVGFLVGALAGFWAAQSNRAAMSQSVLTALAAGWYCWLPLPHRLPVATLIGIVIVLWKRKNR